MTYIYWLQRWFSLVLNIYRNVFGLVDTFLGPFDTFEWPYLCLYIAYIFTLVIHLYRHIFNNIWFWYVKVWLFYHCRCLIKWLQVLFEWVWLWPFIFYLQHRLFWLLLFHRRRTYLRDLLHLLIVHLQNRTYHRFFSFRDLREFNRLRWVIGTFWHHHFFYQDVII